MKGKKNYCKSKHFLSYCSLPIVNGRTNKDNVHTKAAFVCMVLFFRSQNDYLEYIRVNDVSENWQ